MTQPPQGPRTAIGRRSLPDRRGRERRVLAVGLVISALVHLVAIAVIGDWLTPEASRPRPAAAPTLVEPPLGLRAVELSVDPDPGNIEVPEPTPAVVAERVPESRVVVAPERTEATPADSITAADRLAVRVVDPRLWEPMILIPREPTLGDVEARIAAAVELLSDSALAEADAAMRARDWTVEDGEGGKWGISPGKLHLGSITLPLPIWFPVDPEAIAMEAQWYELDQQLERSLILESFQERVRAIRERRERERAEAKQGDNGGG